MEPDLKQKLVGAVVLTVLAAIFLPLILSDQPVTLIESDSSFSQTDQDSDFSSSLIPITEEDEMTEIKEIEITEEKQAAPGTEPANQIIPIDDSIMQQAGESPNDNKPVISGAESVTVNNAGLDSGKEIQSVPEETTDSKKINTSLGTTRAWVVQLASFNSQENARKLNEELTKKGFESFIEPLVDKDKNKVVYRVRVGPPQLDKEKVEQIQKKLKQTMQLDGILIEYP